MERPAFAMTWDAQSRCSISLPSRRIGGDSRLTAGFTITHPSWFIKDLTVRDARGFGNRTLFPSETRRNPRATHGTFPAASLRRDLRETRTRVPGALSSRLTVRCNCTLDRGRLHYLFRVVACLPLARIFAPASSWRTRRRARARARPLAITRVTIYRRRSAVAYACGSLARERNGAIERRPPCVSLQVAAQVVHRSTQREAPRQRNYFFHFSFAAEEERARGVIARRASFSRPIPRARSFRRRSARYSDNYRPSVVHYFL